MNGSYFYANDIGYLEILNGGTEVLKNVKGVLIEVNDAFQEQSSQCQLLLTKAGLVLK
jgi:hypothetical protein